MKEVLLVGNGPSCLNNKFSDLIDSHDMVVRFNDFEIDGYEEYVGTKTDIWVKTKKSNKHNNKIFNKKYYVYPRTLRHSEVDIKNITSDGYEIIPTRLHDEVDKLIGTPNKWSTTGLVMIYHFIKQNYNVTIHGFDFFENGVHYYQDNSSMIGHDPSKEKIIVNKLIKDNLVKPLKIYEKR